MLNLGRENSSGFVGKLTLTPTKWYGMIIGELKTSQDSYAVIFRLSSNHFKGHGEDDFNKWMIHNR